MNKINFEETIYTNDFCIYVFRKKVKRVNLRINKDGIVISANKKVPMNEIKRLVESKIEWIEKNYNKVKEKNIKKMQEENVNYIDNEEIKFLGELFILKVEKADKEKIEIIDNIFTMHVRDIDDFEKKNKLFNKFCYNKAAEIFNESIEYMLTVVDSYNISKPSCIIRTMKTRWGTCNRSKRKITLNLNLIRHSIECIDYVVLHELVHFLVAGHNKKFYGYMDIFMEDWKKRKKTLNGI